MMEAAVFTIFSGDGNAASPFETSVGDGAVKVGDGAVKEGTRGRLGHELRHVVT